MTGQAIDYSKSIPSEISEYMKKYNLSFGKWYTYQKGIKPFQLVDFKLNSFQEWSLVFSSKTLHSIYKKFTWIEVEAPEHKEPDNYTKSGKQKDKEYFKLKTRHETLCLKKLELNRQGKNTLIKNAYINQELELLRLKMSEYS